MTLVQHELQNAYIGQRVDVTSLTLDKNSITLNTAGDTEQITATVVPSGTPITWSSSDTSVATVSSTGLVTCVTPGTATITAEAFGVTATCEVSGSGGWQPGANTIAYYPLTENLNDYSSNGYNLTLDSGASVTYSNNMANFTNGASYNATLLPLSGDFTVGFWCYPNSWNAIYDATQRGPTWQVCNSDEYKGNFKVGGSWRRLGSQSQIPGPCYMAFTRSGSTFTYYLNGQYNSSFTSSGSFESSNRFGISSFSNGVGNVILENRAWTAQEIADYYNQTKSNYGL